MELNRRVYQVVSLGTVIVLVVDCRLSNIALTCEHNMSSSASKAALSNMMVNVLSRQGQNLSIITIFEQALQNFNPVSIGLSFPGGKAAGP